MKKADRELFEAARSGQPERTLAAIEAGADVNARDGGQSTPLHLAATKVNSETLRAVIEGCGEINAKDASERIPLHHATMSTRHADRVVKLRDADAQRQR